MKKRLILEKSFTQKEIKILQIMHQIQHKTSTNEIYNWANNIKYKELGVVLHHLLFACRDFLGSIFTLLHDSGYHAAYVVGSSMVEYFIDFSFILKNQIFTNSRAKEYFDAIKENRKPFSNDENFKKIRQRAAKAQLNNLYDRTYKSLCSFKHTNLKGHLVTRRDDKLGKDRKKFMLQMTNLYLEMWQLLSSSLEIQLHQSIKELLSDEFIKIEELSKSEDFKL